MEIIKCGRSPDKLDSLQLGKATEGLTRSDIEQLFIDALHDPFSRREEQADLSIAMLLNELVPLHKKEMSFHFSSDGGLRALDLRDYLSQGSLHQTAMDAMEPSEETLQFGRRQLVFKSFVLDPFNLVEALSHHSRVRPVAAPAARQPASGQPPPTSQEN